MRVFPEKFSEISGIFIFIFIFIFIIFILSIFYDFFIGLEATGAC